jgi:hypothetical protein
MLFFPIIELVDRYSIAQLKFKRTYGNQAELDFYTEQLKPHDLSKIQNELEELNNIHDCIWDLEALLKSGRESEISLEEIGRRAIEIRNWNHRRIELKNRMADILGCTVREIKQNHLSE